MNGSTMDVRKKKKHETPTKESYSSKDPRNNLRPLATAAEDVLHVHSGHNGDSSGGKATGHLCSLRLAGMVWEPRRHTTKILADVEL